MGMKCTDITRLSKGKLIYRLLLDVISVKTFSIMLYVFQVRQILIKYEVCVRLYVDHTKRIDKLNYSLEIYILILLLFCMTYCLINSLDKFRWV